MTSYGTQSLPTLRAALVAWLMVAIITGTAIAGPLEDAEAAYERGDYATAMRIFRPLAEDGDAIAQYYLGALYDKGQGVPQDYAEATKWYGRSSEQGFSIAQHSLGFMYLLGRGVPQDRAQALKWVRRAADQGLAASEFMLGFAYRTGMYSAPQDHAQAIIFLTQYN
jgi:TPR repeat protein